MKNKKLIISMSIILVISILLVAMVGCKDEFSLSNVYDDDYLAKPYVSEVKQLSAISGWQYEEGTGDFLVLSKQEDGVLSSKMLYSLASDKVLFTATTDVESLDFAFFASKLAIVLDPVNEHMDIYDSDGVILSADTTAYTTRQSGSESNIYIANGKTVTVDTSDYSVKVSDTTLAEPMPELEKVGDFYVSFEQDFVLKVYDKNKKFLHDISFIEYNSSQYGEPLGSALTKDGIVLMQFPKKLPSTATSYDYKEDGEKYVIVNVARNLKTGKSADLKIEKGVLYSIMSYEGFNYLVGSQAKISSTGEIVTTHFGFFDNDLNCVFDTKSYGLSGSLAENFPVPLSNGDFMFSDGDFCLIVDKEGNIKNSYFTTNLSSVGINASGMPIYQLNGTNQLYDVSGNLIVTLPETADIMSLSIPSNFVYYTDIETTTDADGIETSTEYYYSYNLNTAQTTKIGETRYVSFEIYNMNYVISNTGDGDSDVVVSKSAYSIIDGTAIYTDVEVSTLISSVSLSGISSQIILFVFEDADGNVTYTKYAVSQKA